MDENEKAATELEAKPPEQPSESEAILREEIAALREEVNFLGEKLSTAMTELEALRSYRGSLPVFSPRTGISEDAASAVKSIFRRKN